MTTRRQLLHRLPTGLLLAAAPKALLAAAPGEARLVTVILRGAMDGLAAVAPFADPAYRELRAGLALPEPGRDGGVLDLDGFFGLHPSLPTLHRWWRAGELLVLHATATPYRARSHFDGQDMLETGLVAAGERGDGWLNRVLQLMGGDGRRQGLAVGPIPPLLLRGPVPVASWSPVGLPALDAEVLERLEDLYAADPELGPAFATGLATRRLLGARGDDGRAAAGDAGDQAVLRMAGETGRLLAAADGMRIAVLELGGWDTHVGQGRQEGRLAARLALLDGMLAALRRSLGPAWRQTALLVVTEFGRTVRPNGSGGTDHGTGGVALLMGGAVAGGRVLGRWPGLAAEKLREGRDLAPTTDLRALLKGVLGPHLSLPEDALAARVFPASAGVLPLPGLLRA